MGVLANVAGDTEDAVNVAGGANMGDTTGSMFYAFGAFLLIYIVGASIYQGYLWLKKRKNRRKNEEES